MDALQFGAPTISSAGSLNRPSKAEIFVGVCLKKGAFDRGKLKEDSNVCEHAEHAPLVRDRQW
jgi:hypothetical protein